MTCSGNWGALPLEAVRVVCHIDRKVLMAAPAQIVPCPAGLISAVPVSEASMILMLLFVCDPVALHGRLGVLVFIGILLYRDQLIEVENLRKRKWAHSFAAFFIFF